MAEVGAADQATGPPLPRGKAKSQPSRANKNLIARLAGAAGLKLVTPGDLTIERRREGDAHVYARKSGKPIMERATKRRLDRLAVPPAYTNVFYATHPRAHIQAIGTDAAGRLQYRYHADWTEVREALKARRLAHLVEALPVIRRMVSQELETPGPTRRHALATALRLVERTAIRAGNHSYERATGSRGVVTLCKANVTVRQHAVALSFRAKGNKAVKRSFEDAGLARSIRELLALPGKRLFQFNDPSGEVRSITTGDLNAYLRELAGRVISIKDFRTLIASSVAVEKLAAMEPAQSERRRKSQILEAVRIVADELDNTPAIARKSYIHASVIDAFEEGRLLRLRKRLKAKPFSPRRERLLISVVRAAAEI